MRNAVLVKCASAFALLAVFAPHPVPAEIELPTADDWTDRGTAIRAGSGWDLRLGGAISPCTVVKKDGLYFLYYIGADGDRSTDGGPRHRALGVATSTDGVTFTKFSGNPVIAHLPHDNEEEGIFSAAATVDSSGTIVLYYGALRSTNSTSDQVDIVVTLATSTDGYSFDDRGAREEFAYVLPGEEVEPIGVMQSADTWYVYFIDNRQWELRLLAGSSMETLTDRGKVSGTGGSAKGGGDPLFLTDTDFVSFIDHFDTRDTLVVRGSLNDPDSLTEVDRYPWGGDSHKHSTTYLDKDAETWFMYYQNRTTNTIEVKTAPLVVDASAAKTPMPPTDLVVE